MVKELERKLTNKADRWGCGRRKRWPPLIAGIVRRYIDDHNTHNSLIWTIDYIETFTTRYLVMIGHMAMFVVTSIVIQINGQCYGNICLIGLILDILHIHTTEGCLGWQWQAVQPTIIEHVLSHKLLSTPNSSTIMH